MKNRTVCFTGHRKIPPEQVDTLALRLKATLIQLINDGYLYFGAGGALGYDTLAAQTVLELKKQYPDVKLILVLPCLSQTRGWSTRDIEIYEDIKNKADKVVYTSQEYTRGCMHKRNRHLVDNSSVCVCYLTESTGGTAYTVDYAHKNNLTVINLGETL
ncbi:MAG: SLOG family protein [Eubacteriales bacterium]